jgi:pilus assembly protein CpaE
VVAVAVVAEEATDMPGSWKNGTRDIFAAFLCDDAALDVARAVAADMGWAPEKCARGGLRNAVQSLSITASPAILMVDLSECGDPLNDINALAEVCEPGTVVIAVGQVNDVRLYRDLIASGIQDYLLKPLSIGQVRDALAQAQAIFTAPKTQEGAATRQHVATAVVGTRGGVGASTLATSLAWAFSTDHKRSTALLDLDVHFGTGALTLDLEPGRGLTDAIDNPGRIDGLFIERAMIRANDHLAILSAEAPITAPLMTDGSAFMQLQEEFRHAFEMTVIDMPRNMLINFPHLLSDVNAVVLTTELTLAGARDAIRLLAWLKANAPMPMSTSWPTRCSRAWARSAAPTSNPRSSASWALPSPSTPRRRPMPRGSARPSWAPTARPRPASRSAMSPRPSPRCPTPAANPTARSGPRHGPVPRCWAGST